jgi:aconitate hydratase
MGSTIAEKLIESHRVGGQGEEVAIQIDQTLTQDATGTLVMLELEALELGRVETEASVQYVDHNLIQDDHRNPDDHLFLQSACRRFGLWFSRPGNGVSHPVHMQCFGEPTKTLLGSDSHTCAGGALGMLAIGAGGLEVALAMAGEPFFMQMPETWGVRLVGELPDWVSAKDVILEMLRRHGVSGGVNRIIEYHGPGVAKLDVWDRHVIANMGAELGATTTVFPSDETTKAFLSKHGRRDAWQPLEADPGARYDHEDEIDLGTLEPLVAKPSSPGNVVPVAEVVGTAVYQSYIGSSANPGFRDLAVAAQMVAGREIDSSVSFDINPATRAVLTDLMKAGFLERLIAAGARLHQAGCNGCIGMGQAPASGRNSLRTVPRNFPGRSGTREDSVWLCSPETATAAALTGQITDPRTLDMPYPRPEPLKRPTSMKQHVESPPSEGTSRDVELIKGPNIGTIPEMHALPDTLEVPVLLKTGDDVSTDEILPAGTRVLPYRSNIEKISEFCFEPLDPSYPARARERQDEGGHAVVGGSNYGQGSSREHAALAPRSLGLAVVMAKDFARIHWQNLVNFGVLPLQFVDDADYDHVERGSVIRFADLHASLHDGEQVEGDLDGRTIQFRHGLSERQRDVLMRGGLIPWLRRRLHEEGKTTDAAS